MSYLFLDFDTIEKYWREKQNLKHCQTFLLIALTQN